MNSAEFMVRYGWNMNKPVPSPGHHMGSGTPINHTLNGTRGEFLLALQSSASNLGSFDY